MENEDRLLLPDDAPDPLGSAVTAGTPAGEPLRFGCDDCTLRHSAHCDDCLVTHMCREDDGSVVVSLDEVRLVRQLQSGGLAPPLLHRRRTS